MISGLTGEDPGSGGEETGEESSYIAMPRYLLVHLSHGHLSSLFKGTLLLTILDW